MGAAGSVAFYTQRVNQVVWPPREAGKVAESRAQERASEAEEQEKCHSGPYSVVTVTSIVRSHWGLAGPPGRCAGCREVVWSGLLLKEGSLGSGEATLLRRTL